jgi:hypothetical protein
MKCVLYERMHFLLSPALHAADPQSIGRMHNQVLCSFCESVHTDSAQRQTRRFIHRRDRTLSTRVQPAALYASNERSSSCCCVCRLIGNQDVNSERDGAAGIASTRHRRAEKHMHGNICFPFSCSFHPVSLMFAPDCHRCTIHSSCFFEFLSAA